jgi:SAM-dependent methyltransferase
MMSWFINGLVHSPFYPHWLAVRKMNQANEVILRDLSGDVLEVGAGDGAKKEIYLKKYPRISSYLATDYSSWDQEFEKVNADVGKFQGLGRILFGFKERIALDHVCSATNLPFESQRFDVHLSFEVLEHIDDPEKFFSEAARVLKPQGKMIFSVPFLFRMHGGEPDHKMDYHRFAYGFFHRMAQVHGLHLAQIYHNTGIGTTVATMVNQWLIRRVMESSFLGRVFFFLVSPGIFFVLNVLGYLLDVDPDQRFATRFHVIYQKP